jgi:hypothetical protein
MVRAGEVKEVRGPSAGFLQRGPQLRAPLQKPGAREIFLNSRQRDAYLKRAP